jgi:DNA-binding CsgD family transcriptional regulator
MANQAETLFLWGRYDLAWQRVAELEQDTLVVKSGLLSEVYYVHASLLLHEGQPDSAYHYAQQCYQLSHETKAIDNEMLGLNLLLHIDSLYNDLPAYIQHHRILDRCRDDYSALVIESQRISTLAKLEAEFNLQQQQNQWHIALLVMVILLVGIVGLVAHLIAKHRQSIADQRIVQLEKQAIEEENLRSRLQNELLELRLAEKEQSLSDVRHDNLLLGKRLAERPDTESGASGQLNNLEHMLNEHCLDFMIRLSHLHPTLTSNEVRLLGFIRMGIKPNSIASALNISSASLNTARYRLRKKLSLPSEVSLRDYLLSI